MTIEFDAIYASHVGLGVQTRLHRARGRRKPRVVGGGHGGRGRQVARGGSIGKCNYSTQNT